MAQVEFEKLTQHQTMYHSHSSTYEGSRSDARGDPQFSFNQDLNFQMDNHQNHHCAWELPVCTRSGCSLPTWNGKFGEYCSKICRDCAWELPICARPGCSLPTWNGKPDEYCSKTCRGNKHHGNRLNMPWQKSKVQIPCCIKDSDVIAFYYPGRLTHVDQLCSASIFGNFHESPFSMQIQGKWNTFNNAEAAYQSLKYNVPTKNFSQLKTGAQAFAYKRKLDKTPHVRDPTFHGFGSSWKAMHAVLEAKFVDRQLGDRLCETDGSFLLEHCEVKGRDVIWSNDNDGQGTNWLGLLLMIVRNSLLSRDNMHDLRKYDLAITEGPASTNKKWMFRVKECTNIVRQALI